MTTVEFQEKISMLLSSPIFAQVNNRNIRKRCETCSKLTIKTPE